jgi:hypothetical protein
VESIHSSRDALYDKMLPLLMGFHVDVIAVYSNQSNCHKWIFSSCTRSTLAYAGQRRFRVPQKVQCKFRVN